MKRIHYQNIGVPKTGTTRVWSVLKQLYVFKSSNIIAKENPLQEQRKLEQYIDIYSPYEITMNFNTHTYRLPPDLIAKIHEYTTHLTISLRNPWEIINSWYNFCVIGTHIEEYGPNGKEIFTANILNDLMFNYPMIFQNWSSCKIPLQVMFYDDLCADPLKYYQTTCDYVGVTYSPPNSIMSLQDRIKRVNITEYKENMLDGLSQDIVVEINDRIIETAKLTGRDLSHWIRK